MFIFLVKHGYGNVVFVEVKYIKSSQFKEVWEIWALK